ncbi:MAG: HNH endonuclease, partial [bacterium]|nr:HNH endonuclease [bacterium]
MPERRKEKSRRRLQMRGVLERVKRDFKNKCYICEYKEPPSINIEHFLPHRGDKDLKFDWDNLFWSCAHCNNTKGDKFDNILNCTNPEHD